MERSWRWQNINPQECSTVGRAELEVAHKISEEDIKVMKRLKKEQVRADMVEEEFQLLRKLFSRNLKNGALQMTSKLCPPFPDVDTFKSVLGEKDLEQRQLALINKVLFKVHQRMMDVYQNMDLFQEILSAKIKTKNYKEVYPIFCCSMSILWSLHCNDNPNTPYWGDSSPTFARYLDPDQLQEQIYQTAIYPGGPWDDFLSPQELQEWKDKREEKRVRLKKRNDDDKVRLQQELMDQKRKVGVLTIMLRRLYFQYTTVKLNYTTEQDITIQVSEGQIQGYEDLLPYIEEIFQPMFPSVEPETMHEQD